MCAEDNSEKFEREVIDFVHAELVSIFGGDGGLPPVCPDTPELPCSPGFTARQWPGGAGLAIITPAALASSERRE